MHNGAINIASFIFGLISLVHLGRIFCPFPVTIGTFSVPEWMSYVAFIFFGILSLLLLRDRHTKSEESKK